MLTPRLRLTADRSAHVPLRFDDAAFVRALEDDASADDETTKTTGKGPLARLLGVQKATDFDFAPFAEDGWTIHARPCITGKAENAILQAGMGPDRTPLVDASQRQWWTEWVLGVSLPEGATENMTGDDRKAFAALSSQNVKVRGEAYADLPTATRDGFNARLRAHADVMGRPADRDPLPQEESTASWSPGTLGS